MEWLGLIGTIVSILGAWVSIHYAARAKKVVEKAEDQIRSRRAISELSALGERGKEVVRSTRVFSLPYKATARRGRAVDSIAEKILEYVEEVGRCEDSLSSLDPPLRDRLNAIQGTLGSLMRADAHNREQALANDLYQELMDLDAGICKCLHKHEGTVQLLL